MSRVTKGAAFRWGLVSILAIVATVALRAPAALGEVAQGAFLGIAGLVGLYGGAQTMDNALKGKYYRAELDKGEKDA